MELKPLDFDFLSKSAVKYYGTDSYGHDIYLYHDIAFVDSDGKLIPYTLIDEE